MGIIKKLMQPLSKYDKTIPYTYEAQVDALRGYNGEHYYNYYIADTICGLLEYLDEKGIEPLDVQLRGVYMDKEIKLDIAHCTTPNGQWLKRPRICRSLEKYYKKTMIDIYRGHTGEDSCLYNDRDTKGEGPF